MTHQQKIEFDTTGDGDMVDLSLHLSQCVRDAGITTGLCSVHVAGSTAGVTTIEFEPGLQKDFPEALERLASKSAKYEHDRTWGDGNGFSHVRAAMMGPSMSVPLAAGELVLGTWQQVICVDFDNGPRERRLIVTVLGP